MPKVNFDQALGWAYEVLGQAARDEEGNAVFTDDQLMEMGIAEAIIDDAIAETSAEAAENAPAWWQFWK